MSIVNKILLSLILEVFSPKFEGKNSSRNSLASFGGGGGDVGHFDAGK